MENNSVNTNDPSGLVEFSDGNGFILGMLSVFEGPLLIFILVGGPGGLYCGRSKYKFGPQFASSDGGSPRQRFWQQVCGHAQDATEMDASQPPFAYANEPGCRDGSDHFRRAWLGGCHARTTPWRLQAPITTIEHTPRGLFSGLVWVGVRCRWRISSVPKQVAKRFSD